MKKSKNLFFTLIIMSAVFVFTTLWLTSCNSDDKKESSDTSDSLSETIFESENISEALSTFEDESKNPSETDSDTSALPDETTETPHEPQLITEVNFSNLDDKNLSTYFTSAKYSSVELVDSENGKKALKLSTKNVSSVNSSEPSVNFKFKKYIQSSNDIAPSTTEYPILVIKVKSESLWSNAFRLGVAYTESGSSSSNPVIYSHMKDVEDWQYLTFDLSEYAKNAVTFTFSYEMGARQDGETMYIEEIKFFKDAHSAFEYTNTSDTYPVASQTKDDYTLKVMQFNIQTENGATTKHSIRADMFRDLIEKYQPDSIGMEEVTTNWTAWLNSYVFNESYAGVGEPRSTGGEACPIYYRKDKFELLEYGTFWLSDTVDEVGSMFENANYPRICTWAHLKDKETGLEYVHINTHLDHNGKNSASDGNKIRRDQIRVALEQLLKFKDIPAVFTGDFNQAQHKTNGDETPVYSCITGKTEFTATDGQTITGWFSDSRLDAKTTVPEDRLATMTKYYEEGSSSYNPSREPIDYVFYTKDSLVPLLYDTMLINKDGCMISDHLPLYCEFKFKSAQ